jgi:hypothetical protein
MMGNDRQAFVGAYVRPEVRNAARDYAASIETSVSQWLSDLLERELKRLGMRLEPEDKGPKLPFEEGGS